MQLRLIELFGGIGSQAVNSNTQLYKQAGNAIVVDVLAAIFTELLKSYGGEQNGSKKNHDD